MAGVLLGLFVTSEAGVPAVAQVDTSVAGALNSISCASPTSCVAVGYRSPTPAKRATTLAERWNGTKWSVVPSPDPAGSSSAALYGVACTSAKNCLAVGSYFVTSSGATLVAAEKWNGTKWSLVSAPSPAGFSTTYLQAITCTSGTNCWAAGSSMGTSKNATLIERWNGSTWSIVSSPSPSTAKPDVLTGVACGSASQCWAVGYWFPGSLSGSLTEEWNGSKWSVVAAPSTSSGQLIRDACTSSSACLAVGIGNNLFAIAQHWNGTKWITTTPATPSGASTSELNAAACTSASACESVGTYNVSTADNPTLGESWNGSKWTLQPMPSISGSVFATLEGISCPKPGDCWAAGQSDTSSGSSPLLEQWNGKTWSVK